MYIYLRLGYYRFSPSETLLPILPFTHHLPHNFVSVGVSEFPAADRTARLTVYPAILSTARSTPTTMPLAESWVKLEEAFGGRSTLKGSTEEIRAQYDGLVQALMPMLPPFPENTTITEGEEQGTKYRTYVPKDGEGPFPIAVWFHGMYTPSLLPTRRFWTWCPRPGSGNPGEAQGRPRYEVTFVGLGYGTAR